MAGGREVERQPSPWLAAVEAVSVDRHRSARPGRRRPADRRPPGRPGSPGRRRVREVSRVRRGRGTFGKLPDVPRQQAGAENEPAVAAITRSAASMPRWLGEPSSADGPGQVGHLGVQRLPHECREEQGRGLLLTRSHAGQDLHPGDLAGVQCPTPAFLLEHTGRSHGALEDGRSVPKCRRAPSRGGFETATRCAVAPPTPPRPLSRPDQPPNAPRMAATVVGRRSGPSRRRCSTASRYQGSDRLPRAGSGGIEDPAILVRERYLAFAA